jgi:hypothetical protein
MKAVRLTLAALVCCAPLLAQAQWQWVDKDGRKVFSDRPPPADVPAGKILRQPGGRPAAAAEAAPAAAPAPAAAAVVAPPAEGRDKGLEEKRKQAEAAAAEKKKAEEAKLAALKADNCQRARDGKNAIDSGLRMARVNDKGEREILDDNQRAAEAKHLQAVIDRDCAKQAQ